MLFKLSFGVFEFMKWSISVVLKPEKMHMCLQLGFQNHLAMEHGNILLHHKAIHWPFKTLLIVKYRKE